jgi:hypothetical protein
MLGSRLGARDDRAVAAEVLGGVERLVRRQQELVRRLAVEREGGDPEADIRAIEALVPSASTPFRLPLREASRARRGESVLLL